VKRFSDLTEQEILALAITNEEEDSRIYRGFAEGLREQFPSSAKVFDEMADEEVTHRTRLYDLYRQKFGEYLPLIRRQDVQGFIQHRSTLWLMRPLGLEEVRKFAENMEYEAERFYRKAAANARDASVRQLLVDLAEAEAGHESLAHQLSQEILTKSARSEEDETARRMFVLQYVQPGLAGLMDGSVSTLAPLFGRPSPPTTRGRHSWSVSPPRSAPVFRWALPRRCRTTARSPAAARRCCAAR